MIQRMTWELDRILAATGARVIHWQGARHLRPIHRLADAGPGTLYFVADRSEMNETLFQTLTRAEASGLVIFAAHEPPAPHRYPHLGVLSLPSPPQGYLQLAAIARAGVRGLVAGVTGSSGKSSAAAYLTTLLRRRGQVHAARGGLTQTSDCAGLLLAMDGSESEAAVVEMAGDVEQMALLARPQAGIITELNGTRHEMARLGLHLPPDGLLVLHGEDPDFHLLPRDQIHARIITFGAGPGNEARYEDVTVDGACTRFYLRIGAARMPVRLAARGDAEAPGATAAALLAHRLGFTPDEIIAGLQATAS